MSIRRIAIACPSLHPFYIRTVGALCKAFEQSGVTAVPLLQWIEGSQMETFVEAFRPDVLMEINRSRNQLTGLPPSVRHIAWIQDSIIHRPEGRRIINDEQLGVSIGFGIWVHPSFV